MIAHGMLYILDGSNAPVPCKKLETWAKWRRSHSEVLAFDEAGEAMVKTVFLGVDVQLDDGPPVTFNSEVFLAIDHRKHQRALESRFYETYNEAMVGHLALVAAFGKVAGIIMGDKG